MGKPEERNSIVSLEDEYGNMIPLFEGDNYWYASSIAKKVTSNPVDCYLENVHHYGEEGRRFATEKAAQKLLDAEAIAGLTVIQIMPIFQKALKEDPTFFETWQASIAVYFQDEWAKYFSDADENKKIMVVISNGAAERFLNHFIAQP